MTARLRNDDGGLLLLGKVRVGPARVDGRKLTNDYILAIIAGRAWAETKLRAERLTTRCGSGISSGIVLSRAATLRCLASPSRHGNATPFKSCGSGVTNALRSCFGVRNSQLVGYAGRASRFLRWVRHLFAQEVWADTEKEAGGETEAAKSDFEAQAMNALLWDVVPRCLR